MNPTVFADLRNSLATLYPDEASIRRITTDSGIDGLRIILNSTAINNWHTVLLEAEKIQQVNALLDVVVREYGSNQEFQKACDRYRRGITQTGGTNSAQRSAGSNTEIMIDNNPFLYGNPVQPDQFIGRRAILRRVVGRILNQGQSTALVGEPRLGKTSLLHYLEAAQTRATLYGAKAERLHFCYLDTQILSGDCTLPQFWELALRTIRGNVAPASPIGQQLQQSAASGHNVFALETLFQTLHAAGHQFVLLIDEFDLLLHHPLLSHAQFFGSLRSLASRSRGAFTLIIASRLSLARLNAETQRYNPTGSPFFNIFDEVTLGTLTLQEVDQLLRVAGDRFTLEDRHFIESLAGGHPYLLQSTAAAMWEAYAEVVMESATRQRYVLAELRRNQYHHFADTWRVWSPPVRQAFTAVALLNTSAAALPAVGLDLTSFRERLPHLSPELSSLELSGVIKRLQNSSDSWQVAQGVLLTWLWDELIREIRDERTLSRWLQHAELDAQLSNSQRQDLWELFSAVRQLTIINTGGGFYIGGNVQSGGDFIGRDQTTRS